jgi:hypothetical protein
MPSRRASPPVNAPPPTDKEETLEKETHQDELTDEEVNICRSVVVNESYHLFLLAIL